MPPRLDSSNWARNSCSDARSSTRIVSVSSQLREERIVAIPTISNLVRPCPTQSTRSADSWIDA